MSFNKEEHIKRMKPHTDKIVAQLKSKLGVTFQPTDENAENVIFTSKDKVIKVSHHSFYRYSGICFIYKDGVEKNQIETIEVTDEMFMNNFMKPIIELHFKSKE